MPISHEVITLVLDFTDNTYNRLIIKRLTHHHLPFQCVTLILYRALT